VFSGQNRKKIEQKDSKEKIIWTVYVTACIHTTSSFELHKYNTDSSTEWNSMVGGRCHWDGDEIVYL